MTNHERRVRLGVAAVGLAMAVTSAVLVTALLWQRDTRMTILLSLISAMPMTWTAPVLVLAHEADALRSPRYRAVVARAATFVLLGTGAVFVVGVLAVAWGTLEMVNVFAGVTIVGSLILAPPALVCLSYLVALLWKRLTREPEPGEE